MRRSHVAALLIRGFTQRQIVDGLREMADFNPATEEGWTLYTVHKDIMHLRAEWQKEALADIIQHKANRLAELAELKRVAWKDKHFSLVLQIIRQENEMLGLNAPVKIDASVEPRGKVTIYLPNNGRDTEGADAD